MTINDIINHLETRFPLGWQEDFDNCGVQCGDRFQECSGALVCFNITEKVVNEALAKGANLIISHHPLIFSGLKKIEPTNTVGRIICKALEHRLLLYSMHTNIDSGTGGGNDLLAQKLNLQEVEVLSPQEEEEEVGLGRVGNLPKPLPVADFLAFVKRALGVSHVRFSAKAGQMVQRVAVCGGGGSSLIRQAQRAGADIFVTGDIKYHDFFTTENQMAIADVGHFESEHFIKEIIYSELKENFSTFAISISEGETSGVEFL